MAIRHRDDARRLLSLAVVLGRGATFCIYDVMDDAHWYRTVLDGDGPLVVGGALTGALEGLRRCGATPADVLSCPVVSPGGAVTAEDLEVAAGWLATGLFHDGDAMLEQLMVDRTLTSRRWATDPAHVTSLILAIAVIAGHAGDHDHA